MVKSAIVTGGAGFIGSRLVERMLGRDWYVYVVDDFSTHSDSSRYTLPDKNVSFSQGRVQDHSYYKFDANPPDVIIHLAGKVGPIGVMRYKGSIAHDTITAAAAVSEWASNYECPLIFVSTSEVYGSPDTLNRETDATTIQTVSARSEYAVAKLAAEHMLLNRSSIDIRVIRPFNIAGPGQRPEGGFVLPRWIESVDKNEPFKVYLPGTQKRAFTHIDDFIDGLALVYQRGVSGQIYNLGNEANAITMVDLALEVAAHAYGTSGHWDYELVDPFELNGPDFKEAPDKIPDSTKARTELGWNPIRNNCWIIDDMLLKERYW